VARTADGKAGERSVKPTKASLRPVRHPPAGERPATRHVGKLLLLEETQADRVSVEAFELITRKLRVGRVPMLFRALAAQKALLPCWQALRPTVRLRAFEEAADDLRIRAAQVTVELGCPLIETQLEWAGYDVDEIDEIRGQVNVFHYQNTKLLLAAAVLCEAVRGGCGNASPGRATGRAMQRVPRGIPQDMDAVELVPEDANGALAKTFKQIRAHTGLGLVADDYRALGRWPRYLELAWADARARDLQPRAIAALEELRAFARAAAADLPVHVEVTPAQLTEAGADPAAVQTLLERFLDAQPGLVLDMALFKTQLDGAQDARQSPFPIRWKYLAQDDYLTAEVDAAVRLRAGDPTSLESLDEQPRENRDDGEEAGKH
jgi:Halocarboxylic acid dehydrogenase DehI